MQHFDDTELKSAPQANVPMEKLTSIELEPSLCVLQLNLDYNGHYADFLVYPSTARLANSTIKSKNQRGIPFQADPILNDATIQKIYKCLLNQKPKFYCRIFPFVLAKYRLVFTLGDF